VTGILVGPFVGEFVAVSSDGCFVGCLLEVGEIEPNDVGCALANSVGFPVGEFVRPLVGNEVGNFVGPPVGDEVGNFVGPPVIIFEGPSVGASVIKLGADDG